MEQENLNIDGFNSVNFLFAKPAYQGHYYFALDDIPQALHQVSYQAFEDIHRRTKSPFHKSYLMLQLFQESYPAQVYCKRLSF